MSDDEASWLKETVQNKESAWTRENEQSTPSTIQNSTKSSRPTKETELREKNKRFRVIFEDEGLDYGKDATENEIAVRFQQAISLREKRLQQVFKLIRQAGFVQLCFLIDATGSMGPHINGVKNSIKKIVDYLLKPELGNQAIVNKLQLGIIAYRDYCDTKQFEELQFTKSVESFETFCQQIKPFGGGDACEDVLGGLNHALKLNWDPEVGTKVIFHMGDAPAHGREFHNSNEKSYDNYLDGDPNGLKYTELFQHLRQKNIEYHFGKITNQTDTMIEKFSSAYGEAIVDFNVTNVEKIYESVVSAVEMSVNSSISKSTIVAATKREIRPHVLDPNEPDWLKCTECNGTFVSYSFPKSIQNIVDDVPMERRASKSAKVKIADHPFAKGAERLAFYGLVMSTYVKGYVKKAKEKEENPIEIKQKNEKIVLKEYLHIGRGMNTGKRYELTNQMQTIASYLALEFTKKLKSKAGIDRTIKFLKIRTLSVGSGKDIRFMSCERRYNKDDMFIRFTNNTNYIILASKAQKIGVPLEFIEILMTFSHWTYQASKTNLMIVDLQGIITTDEKHQKQVILTDPAIHCQDNTRFGPMNHAGGGIRNFFERHTCNRFCKKLGLVKPVL